MLYPAAVYRRGGIYSLFGDEFYFAASADLFCQDAGVVLHEPAWDACDPYAVPVRLQVC